MSKLTSLAACEKVLHDTDGNPTLFHVFSAIVLGEAKQLDPNMMLHKPWYVFTFWLAEEGELNQNFEQGCRIIAPDGRLFGEARLQFTMTRPTHNLYLTIPGLPIATEGSMAISVWLEREGKKITDEYTTWIKVLYKKEEDKTESV